VRWVKERAPVEKTSSFDAAVEFSRGSRGEQLSVSLLLGEVPIFATLRFLDKPAENTEKISFVHVQTAQPLFLKWKDRFTVKSPDNKELWGKGSVLDPFPGKIIHRQKKRRLEYLQGLMGDEKMMLLAAVQFRGIHGIGEKEIIRFGHLSQSSLLELSQELEKEGKIRILEFSPLFLISQTGIAFLCEKILSFLVQYHEKYPGEVGTLRGKIQKRFDVHPRILNLALKYLSHEGRIKVASDHVALSSFEMALLPEEEKILNRLEDLCLEGKFQSISLKDLQKFFRLSSKRLNKMLLLLVERNKIVLGSDGFILHSRWLDEIIQKVRNSGKRELTVPEFKKMTGLSRKYAIPLLELLDQMGVTRRRGGSREIL
jgi:selenocysteine-specific elongation factor